MKIPITLALVLSCSNILSMQNFLTLIWPRQATNAAEQLEAINLQLKRACVTNNFDEFFAIVDKQKNREQAAFLNMDIQGVRPIHWACEHGNNGALRELITRAEQHNQKALVVNSLSSRHNTPLHFAVRKNNIEAVRYLLEHEALINAGTHSHATPLLYAAACGHTELIRLLAENGASLIKTGDHGYSPLHVACHNEQIDTAEVLIELGSNITQTDDQGDTPLHLAACANLPSIAALLIKLRPDLCFKENNKGHTALHLAAEFNALEVAKVLIKTGANVNALAHGDGSTPLHHAIRESHTRIMDLLQKSGASITTLYNNEYTILHVAGFKAQHFVRMKQHVLIGNLQILGAEIEARNPVTLETPLHTAVRNGSYDTVQSLLHLGASLSARDAQQKTPGDYDTQGVLSLAYSRALTKNPNLKDSSGTNLLMRIVERNCSQGVAEMLEDSRVDVNCKDNSGNTVLHIAVAGGYFEIVKILLSHDKTDAKAKNNDGDTPLHLAVAWQRSNLVRFFLLSVKNCELERNNFGSTPKDAAADKPAILAEFTRLEHLRTLLGDSSFFFSRLPTELRKKVEDFARNCNQILAFNSSLPNIQ